MRKLTSSCVLAGAAVALLAATNSAQASVLLYSFETGDSPNSLDGFAKNGGGTTLSQSTIDATNGANSLLITATGAGFLGDLTSTIPAVLNNPAVTAISADISVPTGTTYTGTNAPFIGVTIFIYNPADVNNGGAPEAAQFQVDGFDEAGIPFLTPGVNKIVVIPLTGSDPDSGNDVTYAQILSEGFVPTGFEFFLDKNAPINLTVDNVQAVGVSVPEPASLSIIGLSGLTMLGRRRRVALDA